MVERKPIASKKALSNLKEICSLAESSVKKIDKDGPALSKHQDNILKGAAWLRKYISAVESKRKNYGKRKV